MTGVDVGPVGEGVGGGFVIWAGATSPATGTDAVSACSGEWAKGQGSGRRLVGEAGVGKANRAVDPEKQDFEATLSPYTTAQHGELDWRYGMTNLLSARDTSSKDH